MRFSFIDFDKKDFLRNPSGSVLILDFDSWGDAEDFVIEGGLMKFGWINSGIQKFCWDDDEY